jgi:hypothetical protein
MMRSFLIATIAISLVVFGFAAREARAETRIYELLITDTENGKTRVVTSTLDNYQYPGYHHVKPTETVEIQDSWMCWKRSDHYQRFCPRPDRTATR